MKDEIIRCDWCIGHDDYKHYHDKEWGRPIDNDFKLFEKMCLEGFQAGLSWLTILRKRGSFRNVFVDFDFYKIANFNQHDINRLLKDKRIVRHRGKIEATINNAKCSIEIVKHFGSLGAYVWQWEPNITKHNIDGKQEVYNIPTKTKTSQELSKDLKNKGWNFFGPTTAYAFMQAVGMVNDHQYDCVFKDEVENLRKSFKRPVHKIKKV